MSEQGISYAAANDKTGSLGFESKLWDAADLLRSSMDPAEYKHVVLGLIFLKYISDAFEERRETLTSQVREPGGEYFVEGEGGGEFYTPTSIVRVLVEMIEPYKGRVYDPCCGSGGMFVQSLRFVEAHGGRSDDASIYGQELNYTTWRLARMNLAIRGIEANLGPKHADSFRSDLHPDLRADFILANPPFNISQWHGDQLKDDVRWQYGVPPEGNANFAWVQHFVHHLAPHGITGFVLANGSMSSMTGGEGDIRRRLVEADLVDCIVAMPGQLFYATQIPVCLWFLRKDRASVAKDRTGHFRDRSGHTLFIDARKLGRMETRVHKILDEADIERIAGTYHAWRNPDGDFEDEAGFCKCAALEEEEDDGIPFEDKMARLTAEWHAQQAEAERLSAAISANLASLGFGADGGEDMTESSP